MIFMIQVLISIAIYIAYVTLLFNTVQIIFLNEYLPFWCYLL
jgi:hypothetical protein